MLENIKFCLLMTISKVLAAGVTCFIFAIIMAIALPLSWLLGGNNTDFGHEIYVYIVGSITFAILALIGSKLSLSCFRCALKIAENNKEVPKKSNKTK